MKTIFRIIVVLVLLTGLALWAGLRSFRAFLEEELVAVVRCEPAPPGLPYRFLVEVTQVERGVPGRREKFPMTGDQWSAGGDILKWKPWLTFLGLKSLHQLTRLSSRYDRAQDEMNRPRAAYDLNGGSRVPWSFLRRWGMLLPFVDAVYGNAAYVPMQPGGQWGVYVTHAGYLIRPLRGLPA